MTSPQQIFKIPPVGNQIWDCRRKLSELPPNRDGLDAFKSSVLLICNNARKYASHLNDADLISTADQFQARLEALYSKTLREVDSWTFVTRR